MIDFHSHIIPSIDDGAKDIGETFLMLEEASKAGFDGVISTSHYIENYYEVPEKDRKAWVCALSQGIEKKDININLYLGSEVYFSENILHLIQGGKASTINNSRYVLFEFPMNTQPMNIEEFIYSLLEHKYVPILAHPERYVFTQERPELIYQMANDGVLMQSNYGSIIGQYGTKAQVIVEKMLESNLVSFLGSDVHRPKSIYTRLDSATKKIKDIIGNNEFDKITHYNPLKVIKNEKIELEYDPSPIKLTLTDKIKMGLGK